MSATATPLNAVQAKGLHTVLLTGMSGSGKSVALHALEDAGYYCVDNLPPELLMPFVEHAHANGLERVAVAIDVRSANALPQLPKRLQQLREQGWGLTVLFLDATDETLIHRFSETRRRHPLSAPDTSDQQHALTEAIALEREWLGLMREHAQILDTSTLRAAQLQTLIKERTAAPIDKPTLVFQSFAFKRGVPVDADYVFDLRMLPNPFYEVDLRPLTGRDAPVASYLAQQPPVQQMEEHIAQFLQHWLPALAQNHRSYVTVALGCTGGQHRSVYLVERLQARFKDQWHSMARHRELA